MSTYKAPKPEYSAWEWFGYIALRVAFPPILLWDLIKLGVNHLLGEWVGGLVLPAQDIDFTWCQLTDENVNRYHDTNLTFARHEVITHDGAHLDTFEVAHNSQKKLASKDKKYIINLVGNGGCYEEIINTMKEDADALHANVVGFNLRGVGQSTGRAKSKENLVTDGIAQVQRLLDRGVSPQNIILKGHSLGAGIASLVADHFHKIEKPINLFSSRSFSSITNFLVGRIRGHKESIGGIILGWLAKPFIKLGVALAKWEINAGSAFQSIPDANKDYIVIRSRNAIRDDRIDDAVIPHYASIHQDLAPQRCERKAAIDSEIKRIENMMREADPITKPGLLYAKNALIQAREKIKSERKMETSQSNEDGHTSDWTSISNRFGKNAQTFFYEFCERTQRECSVQTPIQGVIKI